MKSDHTSAIPRRSVLQGALGAAGAAALGFLPSEAHGRALEMPKVRAHFLQGTEMLDARTLGRGDAGLREVVVSLSTFGNNSTIDALTFWAEIEEGGKRRHTPFAAYTAPPAGIGIARFVAALDASGRLPFSARLAGYEDTEVRDAFSASQAGDVILREGTYLLSAPVLAPVGPLRGQRSWARAQAVGRRGAANGVLLRIERA